MPERERPDKTSVLHLCYVAFFPLCNVLIVSSNADIFFWQYKCKNVARIRIQICTPHFTSNRTQGIQTLNFICKPVINEQLKTVPRFNVNLKKKSVIYWGKMINLSRFIIALVL